MQLQPYKIKVEVPAKIQDMELSLSISETIETLNSRQQKQIQIKAKGINIEMAKIESVESKEYLLLLHKKQALKNEFDKIDNTKVVQTELVLIISKYLAMNIKGRAITNDEGLILLSEVILNDHGNLGLNEIAFALKRGIVGAYGVIYNDISIDTVFNWITQYKEIDRPKIKEKDYTNFSEKYKRLENYEKLITLDEFLEKNPDEKIKRQINEFKDQAKKGHITIERFKDYVKLKELGKDFVKDFMEKETKEYHNQPEEIKKLYTEMKHIINAMCIFIIQSK